MKGMRIGAFLLPVAVAIVTLPAEAQQQPTLYSYQCDDGRTFEAEYSSNAATLELDNRSVTLAQIPAASGTRYSDGQITLYSQGNEAFIEVNGDRLYNNCITQDFAAEEATTGETITEETTTRETSEESVTQESVTTEQTTTQQTSPQPAPQTSPDPAPVRALW
ncbi:MAG: lysozyme inhibitor [Cyanobacteria bacterium CRU_2_1]|nr:lysozyme inhibitor [Cyanobacteria bacterium RU_5_0]NJR59952.1 lysozyme inhibitor [Cyanobacteria bacterium CRU_2_1]